MSDELSDFFSKKLILGIAIGIGFYGALKFFGVLTPSQNSVEPALAFDYSMVRPEAERGDFDLSGRSVQRIHLNPKSKDGKSPTSEAALKAGQIAAQKTNSQAKKEADKKKAAAAAAAKKKKMSVQVVDTARDPRLSGSAKSSDPRADPRLARQASLDAFEEPQAPLESQKEEEPVLSAEQWREKLAASPSVSLALEFVRAYRDQKVSSQDFYAVSLNLIGNDSEQVSSLARYILTVESNSQTFAAVALALPEADDSVAAKLRGILNTYAQRDRLGDLSQVLMGSDVVVVSEAFRVLDVAVNLAQPNAQSGPGQQLIPASSLMIFVPALTSLQSNPDQNFAAMAQAVLQRIQNILQA